MTDMKCAEGCAMPDLLIRLVGINSEGAFRMGARAMRAQIEQRLVAYGFATLAADTPIPMFPPIQPAAAPEWRWWAGDNEEWYSHGPFDTREEAVKALDGYGGHVTEAIQQSVKFSADNLLDDQYFDGDDLFDMDRTEPDRIGGADLIAAADAELQTLLDAWAARWQHTFAAPSLFAGTRNGEAIAAEAVA